MALLWLCSALPCHFLVVQCIVVSMLCAMHCHVIAWSVAFPYKRMACKPSLLGISKHTLRDVALSTHSTRMGQALSPPLSPHCIKQTLSPSTPHQSLATSLNKRKPSETSRHSSSPLPCH
eukprot:gb/GEZN01017563.1/.p1 GENE.gb/GEZN01017563.1/~~gb/GEZN01017563.1/.p1  ORF type:complete len:120 (-),score=0.69 gb/GEZN01017563.1/:4-363(-)